MWGKPLIFYLHRKSRRENRWIHSAAFSMETGRKTASGHRLYTCGEAATFIPNSSFEQSFHSQSRGTLNPEPLNLKP